MRSSLYPCGYTANANTAQHEISSTDSIFKRYCLTHCERAALAPHYSLAERHHDPCSFEIRIVQHNLIHSELSRGLIYAKNNEGSSTPPPPINATLPIALLMAFLQFVAIGQASQRTDRSGR